MRASHWLAVTLHVLPLPADTAVARAEQLLHDADGDLWAEADLLKPLGVLYAYIGRAADARSAIDRSQSIFADFGARIALAESAVPASLVGLITGDPVAAERHARQGYETVRAMGERGGYLVDLAGLLAEALYAQGRFDEAQQVLDQAYAECSPGAMNNASLIEAELLARRGEFSAARQTIAQIEAMGAPASSPGARADTLRAMAEVERLAGAPDRAAASLRAALRIYEDQRATTLAEQITAALATLAGQPGRTPA